MELHYRMKTHVCLFEYFMGKYTPLMIASAYGNHETVNDLITNHGANAFKTALEGGRTEIDAKHKGALNQGELGKIFKDYDKYGLLDSNGQKQQDLSLTFKHGLEQNLEIGGTSFN